MRLFNTILFACGATLLVGCEPVTYNYGQNINPPKTQQVSPKIQRKPNFVKHKKITTLTTKSLNKIAIKPITDSRNVPANMLSNLKWTTYTSMGLPFNHQYKVQLNQPVSNAIRQALVDNLSQDGMVSSQASSNLRLNSTLQKISMYNEKSFLKNMITTTLTMHFSLNNRKGKVLWQQTITAKANADFNFAFAPKASINSFNNALDNLSNQLASNEGLNNALQK